MPFVLLGILLHRMSYPTGFFECSLHGFSWWSLVKDPDSEWWPLPICKAETVTSSGISTLELSPWGPESLARPAGVAAAAAEGDREQACPGGMTAPALCSLGPGLRQTLAEHVTSPDLRCPCSCNTGSTDTYLTGLFWGPSVVPSERVCACLLTSPFILTQMELCSNLVFFVNILGDCGLMGSCKK